MPCVKIQNGHSDRCLQLKIAGIIFKKDDRGEILKSAETNSDRKRIDRGSRIGAFDEAGCLELAE